MVAAAVELSFHDYQSDVQLQLDWYHYLVQPRRPRVLRTYDEEENPETSPLRNVFAGDADPKKGPYDVVR